MKRVRLTIKQYNELTEARDWCAKNGLEGMKRWYDEELANHTKRKALPLSIQPDDDERKNVREYSE